jgi:hypothetical protein
MDVIGAHLQWPPLHTARHNCKSYKDRPLFQRNSAIILFSFYSGAPPASEHVQLPDFLGHGSSALRIVCLSTCPSKPLHLPSACNDPQVGPTRTVDHESEALVVACSGLLGFPREINTLSSLESGNKRRAKTSNALLHTSTSCMCQACCCMPVQAGLDSRWR